MPSIPKLSVIMPVRNGERYLAEAVDSILAQTFEDFEFIIVNDGSTDGTASLLEQYAAQDPRVQLINLESCGISEALNAGIHVSKASFIARMDADDIAYPERFAKQLAYLNEHAECVALGTWVRFIDEAGMPIYTYKTASESATLKAQVLDSNGGALVHPSIIFRKEPLLKVGAYRKEATYIEDLDLFLRLINEGDFHNLPEVLLDYRQHAKSSQFFLEKPRALRMSLVNACRVEHGLVALPESVFMQGPPSLYSTYHTWAQWALHEGYSNTALKYTKKAIFRAPWKLHSWKFLKMVCAHLKRERS